jgi:rfaE bifunctional protein kinase chain/domain/rfaE bifunctional protein nucleotidyltransferase chain/domain
VIIVMNYQKKIVTLDQLRSIVEEAHAQKKVVVQCHGCFDILHPGHLRHLAWAREQGDLLVVSVSADNVVKKDSLRPYIPQDLRAENLAALEFVDYVTIDDHEWAGPILELLKPDIYTKGKEFENVLTGRIGRERQLVESYGGRIRFSSGDVVYSSTRIIEDLKDRLESGVEVVQRYCQRHGITRTRAQQVVDQMRGKQVLVVGDTIVDKYIYCDRLGMSAEAPVLVVRPLESDIFLGGSGVVAQHVTALGATAHFCSVIGQDADAEYVRAELGRRRVSADLIVDPSRPTTVKTRYICDGKKMLKVNQFRDFELDAPVAAQLREKLKGATAVADAIIICDFGYGVVTKSLLQSLCEWGKTRNVPVVGDVQCSSQLGNVTRMKGITLVTPSEREARLALCDRDSGIADLGAMIMAETGNRSVVITLGERGLMIFEAEGEPVTARWKELPVHEIKRHLRSEYLPSFAKVVVDSMGAGDAMLATISCCLATGASLMESAFIGNCSAAVECSKMGNIKVGREELLQVIDQQFTGH